jgi:hypothetical protein
MSGNPRRQPVTRVTDARIVTSEVRGPIAAGSTWRTWVLLLERSEDEELSVSPNVDRDRDRLAY